MKWRPVGLAIFLATGTVSLSGTDGAEASETGALRSSEIGAARLVEVVVPGPLLTVEAFESPSGERSLVLLVEASEGSEGPRFIYQLGLEGSARLSDLPVVLPSGADSVAALDLTGDGVDELLVGEHGRIFRLTGEGQLELALEAEGVDLKARAWSAIDGTNPDANELVLAAVGRATRFVLPPDEGRFRADQEYRIPVRARMQGSWLHLSSPLVTALPSGDKAGTFTYLVGPESIGDRRLRTLILEPGAGSGEAVRELWSQLPSPETVEESRYASLDGEIVLLVTTVQADKRGVFEKEKLRVLRLSEDRSRSGARPILEAESRTRNWYRPGLGVFDVNGDGLDDVVLIQPKGLGAGELVVEAFLGSGTGTFDGKRRRTNLEIETETWSYGPDLDLDGIPDLVLIEEETLMVFLGSRDTSRALVVNEEPSWQVPIGAVDDTLQVRDVVGDARPEVLLIERRGADFRSTDSPARDNSEVDSDSEDEPVRGRLSLVVFSGPGRG